MPQDQQRKPNRLIKEKSPYLLEHAQNPVDWRAWDEEAFAKAKNDGKPIFLSIGYSTCHWCHVMKKESFEDTKVAELINKNFVPIKVDREERPEVDSYYMSAVQSLTGQGGWPLTVFLTPDLKAFYGGTYFPPEPRYGMPSFKQVLEFVAKLWKDSRGDVTKQADSVSDSLIERQMGEAGGPLTAALIDDAFGSLATAFDSEHGGFAGAPKFPRPLSLEFLMRYAFRNRNDLAMRMVSKTLGAMASGGIHDHLAGGFHRYSTDRHWLVPHFEKMLYDNALLAGAFLHAYQVTGNIEMAEVAKGTLGWMLAELESKEGGFYSALDADTEEGEGVYYTWTPQEVEAVLGDREGELFCRRYGVTMNGNFEGGRSILHTAESQEDASRRSEADMVQFRKRTEESRQLLYQARLHRIGPATDTKILTSWNGLAISAFSSAFRSIGGDNYRRAAERAAKFLMSRNFKNGVLLRRFAGGEAGIPGTLEDYSFLGLGLLDLFEATSEPRWLQDSITMAEKIPDLFEDREGGGFYLGGDYIPAKLVDAFDDPLPSGNSAAVMLLLRLSTITGREQFARSADRALRRFQPALEREPTSHSFMMLSVDSVINGTREVVVSSATQAKAEPFLARLRGKFLPDVASFVLTNENKDSLGNMTPLAEGRNPRSEPLAYVCQNFTCKLPAKSPSELEAQLGLVGS